MLDGDSTISFETPRTQEPCSVGCEKIDTIDHDVDDAMVLRPRYLHCLSVKELLTLKFA